MNQPAPFAHPPQSPVDPWGLADLRPASSNPREEVLIRWTRGSGRFSPDKRFIALTMKMFDPDGRPDGYHEGVWEAQFRDPRELLSRPDSPTGRFDVPEGPVEELHRSAETKGIWAFADGSSITAVGAAMSHLIQLEDGSALFMVTCAQTITNGQGRYAGCYGLKTSLGSTHIAAGVDLFGPQDVEFEATTIDTFRVMRAEYLQRR